MAIVWRRHRFSWRGHRLGTYLWDARVGRTACRACALGTGQILRRTWRWVMAKPGERLWRAGTSGAVVGGGVWAVAHYPAVAPSGLMLAWLVAAGVLAPRDAWRLPPESPPAATDPDDAEEKPNEASIADPRAALLDLLDRATRGRNGVHLQELAEHPKLAGLPRPQLARALEAHGVPVTRSLSVDGVAGRSGVRRADVEALLAALPQETGTPAHDPTLSRVDLRKSQPLSPDSQPTLAAVSAAGDAL